MGEREILISEPTDVTLLFQEMLMGAAIALTMIFIFVTGINALDSELENLWMIRPLIVILSAGASASLVYYFLSFVRRLKKTPISI